jgi:hypothetical protein
MSKIQARGVGDPEGTYKLAQAYSILGDRGSALRILQNSIGNGFFPYPYFMTDPLLDGLRGEAQFARSCKMSRHEAFRATLLLSGISIGSSC